MKRKSDGIERKSEHLHRRKILIGIFLRCFFPFSYKLLWIKRKRETWKGLFFRGNLIGSNREEDIFICFVFCSWSGSCLWICEIGNFVKPWVEVHVDDEEEKIENLGKKISLKRVPWRARERMMRLIVILVGGHNKEDGSPESVE